MTTLTKRPVPITGVAIIIAISGIFDIVVGARIAFSPAGTNRAFSRIIGENTILPDWYLLINGALALLLGVMYLWLVRLIINRAQIAQILIQTLAIVNIVFGLTNLPLGWVAIGTNAANLILISTASAKKWLTSRS